MTTQGFWKNKKVLITGGTSGLGKALNHALLAMGAQTAIVARNAKAIQGDISDRHQVHRIFAEAITELGGIDVLFNNASALGSMKLLVDTDCEDFEEVLQTNLLGPFRLSKLAASQMILQRSGLIVNISSDAAIGAYPRWGTYGVSKAALDHLTRVFAAELETTGVKFLALDPGDMNTPMHQAAIPDADLASLHSPEDSAQIILDQIAAEQFAPVRRGIR